MGLGPAHGAGLSRVGTALLHSAGVIPARVAHPRYPAGPGDSGRAGSAPGLLRPVAAFEQLGDVLGRDAVQVQVNRIALITAAGLIVLVEGRPRLWYPEGG